MTKHLKPTAMWDNFIRTFFSGSLEEPLERQVRENEVCPDVIEKTNESRYESDIEALKQKFGDSFSTGLSIEIDLKEILKICPRERRRSDSYTGLIGFLQKKYGIILKVVSQKTKSSNYGF
ncbi:hypothetical protein DXB82_00135 [Phocaeicola vulgatus]|jgi:hypothetical protein|uniref:hypothetical protein n=1 Tax=Phocaeicola vulgatus TaxID=821 RepID=UPI000E4437C1|nr:hypothetical protein [Phocaeicola vulgatus]RGM91200.1 hypothetical protein DXB90_00840 [Phocaeicola vulgatus]RGN09799.1 hypothetical protein DXB82_00135 [Phocaeicola vulgatus]